ncbi:hypothetical protein F4678DRAFT_429593 [Xylaria arbuscula]|nr:hypothetical protein F4678DRAFT_429593 [Xylaria arbuscula]
MSEPTGFDPQETKYRRKAVKHVLSLLTGLGSSTIEAMIKACYDHACGVLFSYNRVSAADDTVSILAEQTAWHSLLREHGTKLKFPFTFNDTAPEQYLPVSKEYAAYRLSKLSLQQVQPSLDVSSKDKAVQAQLSQPAPKSQVFVTASSTANEPNVTDAVQSTSLEDSPPPRHSHRRSHHRRDSAG